MNIKRKVILLFCVGVGFVGSLFFLLRRDYENELVYRTYRWHLSGSVIDVSSNKLDGVSVTVSASGPRGWLDRPLERSSSWHRTYYTQTRTDGFFDIEFVATAGAVIFVKAGFDEELVPFQPDDRREKQERRLIVKLRSVGQEGKP